MREECSVFVFFAALLWVVWVCQWHSKIPLSLQMMYSLPGTDSVYSLIAFDGFGTIV